MGKKGEKRVPEKNHLREWREFRQLTQEELASRMDPPTTGAVISLLESGERGLSDKWLRKLAPALRTTPGHLLDHSPNQIPANIWELWDSIPEADKPQAARVLEAFRKTGTHG